MIDERQIEIYITEYLQRVLPEVTVERFATDAMDVLMRAKQNVVGLVEVSHADTVASYEQVDESGVYEIESEFAVTILVNEQGNGRDDLFDIFLRARDYLSLIDLPGCIVKIVRHQIHPQKFPDMVEGVFIAEIILNIKRLYNGVNDVSIE